MTPSARLSAAIDILAEIEARRRPAADVLKDWGLSHRFAGSGDRAAIAGLVFDALRRRASSAYVMGEQSPRAILLGMLRLERKFSPDAIAELASGARFAPELLAAGERARIEAANLTDAPPWIAGDYPQWLDSHLARAFAEDRAAEGAALASRAPLDLRVNLLKAERDRAAAALTHLHPAPTPWSPFGLRVVLEAAAKNPAIHAEPAFIKGMIEVQDEGSQLAALLAAAKPGEQVIDLCAGSGGKTLALAMLMSNRGQLYATDLDKRRLAPIHARLERAGVHNVQVRTPKDPRNSQENPLPGLDNRADLVLIDAPCTGIGTWRRNPDAKWRMRPGALALRLNEQRELLDRAAALVKPGGRIAYVTCSLLVEENQEQVRNFLAREPRYTPVAPEQVAGVLGERAAAFREAVQCSPEGLLMTPRRTHTDGFFVSLLVKQPG
jgi:16S rRNA (cytosine967-C5)-methyltransferase